MRTNPWRLLTGRGKALLIIGLVATAVATAFGELDLMWVGLLPVMLPLVALVENMTQPLRLTAARHVSPPRVSVGERLTGMLDLRLRDRVSLSLMQFEDNVPAELGRRPRFSSQRILGGWQRRLTYPMTASQRGVFRVGPLAVRTADPLGLTYLQRTFQNRTEVLVTPAVHLLSTSRSGSGIGATGESTPNRIGVVGQDDVLVREHRHGDDMRRVHWRSTAKHGELMVRREEQSWDPSVTLVLDSRRGAHAGHGASGSFEWAVSAVASIAHHLIRHGYRVTILDAEGVRVSGQHGDPTAASEDVLLSMTTQTMSPRPRLSHTLHVAQNQVRSQAIIAVLGDVQAGDVMDLNALRGHGTQGWAVLLNTPTFGQVLGHVSTEKRADALRDLAANRWRVQPVQRGMSVPQAWTGLTQGVVS